MLDEIEYEFVFLFFLKILLHVGNGCLECVVGCESPTADHLVRHRVGVVVTKPLRNCLAFVCLA